MSIVELKLNVVPPKCGSTGDNGKWRTPSVDGPSAQRRTLFRVLVSLIHPNFRCAVPPPIYLKKHYVMLFVAAQYRCDGSGYYPKLGFRKCATGAKIFIFFVVDFFWSGAHRRRCGTSKKSSIMAKLLKKKNDKIFAQFVLNPFLGLIPGRVPGTITNI